jgi:AcrR family transcriptional regulator
MKEPEVRKGEILDAAQKLFVEKGYAKTTVTDILNVYGLSKGLFYHYFKSKEEVMDAIIERIVDTEIANAKKIAALPEMPLPQKLLAIMMGQGLSEESAKDKEALTEQFHTVENAEMHQKSLTLSVKRLAPVLAEIITQCAEFTTDYPLETVELLLAAGQFIFDKSLFQWNEEELLCRAMAFIEMMEKALGAPKGYFEDIKKVITY